MTTPDGDLICRTMIQRSPSVGCRMHGGFPPKTFTLRLPQRSRMSFQKRCPCKLMSFQKCCTRKDIQPLFGNLRVKVYGGKPPRILQPTGRGPLCQGPANEVVIRGIRQHAHPPSGATFQLISLACELLTSPASINFAQFATPRLSSRGMFCRPARTARPKLLPRLHKLQSLKCCKAVFPFQKFSKVADSPPMQPE